jgi:hypothetical protein
MFPSATERRRIRAAELEVDRRAVAGEEEYIEVTLVNDPESRRGRGADIKPPTGPDDYARYQAECNARPDPDTVRTIRIKVRPAHTE